MFPVDPMDSIGPLSNPSPLKEFQNIVYTSGNLSGVDCTSDLIFRPERLHWTPGLVHWNLIESIGHVWKLPPCNLPPSIINTVLPM